MPVKRVSVLLGDMDLPPAPVAGGSISTASVWSMVAQAPGVVWARLFDGSAPAGDLLVALKERGMGSVQEYAERVSHGAPMGALGLHYQGKAQPNGGAKLPNRIQFAFGAQFVEVRLHARTREIHVLRIVGAFASGRIINTRTAHSQYMGGMTWGIGSALHERTEIDTDAARYVNTNLADYLVPVNADVVDVKVIMAPEEDHEVNPLGIKGIGEIGIVGTSAAVANPVHHATGKWLRDFPLRINTLVVGA